MITEGCIPTCIFILQSMDRVIRYLDIIEFIKGCHVQLNIVFFVNEELGEIIETRGNSDQPFLILIGKIGADLVSHFECSGLLNVIVYINSCQNCV